MAGLLPANNLAGSACFDFQQPTAALKAGLTPAKAVAALVDADSAVELYAGFGKNVYTALATIGGAGCGRGGHRRAAVATTVWPRLPGSSACATLSACLW